jgi:PAS domain S-box-containing protein
MPDGAVKYLRVVAHAERDASSELEFVGAVMDVTVAKEAEEKIRLIINTVPGLLWTARPDGWVDFLNQRWLDYTGMTLEQGLGWAWQPGYHPDDLGNVLSKWRAAVAERKPLEVEARLRRSDGDYRWFLKRAFPLFDSAGRVLGWYGGNIDVHDLKQAEEKLRRIETYLSEGQRLSRTGSWAWSVKTKENLFWSREQYRIFGFDPDTESGRYGIARDRIHPADLRAFDEKLDRAIQGKKDFEIDFRIVLSGGEVKHVHNLGHPVLNNSGELVEYIGTTMDMTERKRAEETLRRSENYLAEAQKLTHAGSWAYNILTGELVHSSEEHRRLFGFDSEKGIPSFDELVLRIHPEDRTRALREFETANPSGKDFDAHFRIVLPDGTMKYVYGTGHPVFNLSGDVREFIGTVMDVTERKLAEEALRRSENYLAEAQRLSHTGSWARSSALTGETRYWSEECRRLLGYEPHDAPPSFETFLQRVHPDDQARFKEIAEKAGREKADYQMDYRLIHPSGEIRDIHTIGHPIFSPSGDLIEYVGTAMDVTERKRAEEALRRAQAELTHITRITTMGELTASIAHEVNQPLAAIVNNANACMSLMPDGAPDLAEVREALAEIIEDADRASNVISRVRQLAKRAPIEKSLMDLGDVVNDVLALARYESAARGITIRTDLPGDLPSISGDRVQLQQVLLNLVINGMDAMNTVEESKRVLFIRGHCETRNGRLETLASVQDAGIGFKAEEMGRLFEAFYTTKPQGMGMGLAISRTIIEAHGGRLWAEPNQGPGATFLFSLPASGNAAS